jgi:hypothetical protein
VLGYGVEPVGNVFLRRSRDGFLVSLAQRFEQLTVLEGAGLGTAL